MADQNPNNHSESKDGQQFTDDNFIPAEALPLCPQCLKPCNPQQYYCDNCGSNEIISPLAAYMPFVRIRFVCGGYRKMWHTIWHDGDASIRVKWASLFMVIFFAPIMLVLGLPFFLIEKTKNPTLRKTILVILCVLAAVLVFGLVPWTKF